MPIILFPMRLILKYSFQTTTLLWVCAFMLSIGPLAIAQPSLTKMAPASFAPGKTTEVTIHGAKLTAPLTLWSPAELKIEDVKVAENKKSAVCKIAVPTEQPIGAVAIVAASATGISEPLLCWIDDLPLAVDGGKNHDLEQSQAIAAACVVSGRSDGVQADYFRLPLEDGQVLSVEVVAQRIASKMDPVVRLLDATGKEIFAADDSLGIGADCRFQYTCEQTGEYVLEVRDNRYQAGGIYYLRVGDFPIITSPFPLGARLGATNRLRFTGLSAENTEAVIMRVPDASATAKLAVSAQAVDGKFSAAALLAISELPEAIEAEPNDEVDQSRVVTIPCAVNGVFQSAQDHDCYEFAASKSQRIDITSCGRSLGSPAYAYMQLFDEQGKLLTETAVTDAEELKLSYTPESDGMLRLVVRDLMYRGGKEFAYRAEIRTGPGFSLLLKQEKGTVVKYAAPANGSAFVLKVQAQRRGYDGPIKLALLDADTQIELYGATIPAKANEVAMHVVTPANLEPGELQALRVVGTASINGREVREVMRTESVLRAKLPQMLYPNHLLDGYLSLVATAPQDPFFATSSKQKEAVFTQGAEQCEYVFTIDRKQEDFKAPVTVFAEGLPEGFQATVTNDADSYKVAIKGDKNAAIGEHKISLMSIGYHKGRGQTTRQEIPLRIVAAETKEGA